MLFVSFRLFYLIFNGYFLCPNLEIKAIYVIVYRLE
ncbi:hypothetical protein CoNPh26_CDS0069 [Staphylococcus phage S-CoN_Ph26]|nr:hypothetical protein CoNPh26_CDS0069 [Staphylococcus phage S-CoN_Ph26]